MRKKQSNFKLFEIILVVLIAICMMFLIQVSKNKIGRLVSERDPIITESATVDTELSLQLSEIFKTFKPVSCTMIESYDKDFNQLLRICFHSECYLDDGTINHICSPIDIKDHPLLKDILSKNMEGTTQISIGDKEENIYFRWIADANHDMTLTLVYLSRPEMVGELWLIELLCYIVLILVCVLVIRLLFFQKRQMISEYKISSDRLRRHLIE